MRTLAITQNITLDGIVEMTEPWFDPAEQDGQDDVLAELHRQDAASDALLLGRQTFTDFRGYWPLQTDDTSGITAYLNQVSKYVVSQTMTNPEWEHSTILSGDPLEQVRELKAAPGRDVVVTGSIRLSHALIAAGLVDEYRLFVYPVVVGRGRRLFEDAGLVGRLELTDLRRFDSGISLLRYAAR